MIAAHSSPVAPPRVPSREFPVVSAHPQLQTARAGSGQPRPSTSHPLRSSLPSRPHDLTADYTQTANSTPPKARNPTSKLPTPPGEPTLPTPKIGPAALVPRQIPRKERPVRLLSQRRHPNRTRARQDIVMAQQSRTSRITIIKQLQVLHQQTVRTRRLQSHLRKQHLLQHQ